jgi:multiple sugar transport system substrate-binding protein
LKTALRAIVVGTALGLTGCADGPGDAAVTVRFWAMGREGEVVRELVPEFERENPGIRVEVQQIPWSAAHEKLLTAHVGRATPDVAQLGNTWIAEFVALNALRPLPPDAFEEGVFFPGIWETNVLDGVPWGVPWYVDTRVLFYRSDLFRRAGHDTFPRSWEGWRAALEDVGEILGERDYPAFLPANEWPLPVILGLQAGSPLLADGDTRGAFAEPAFRRAFEFVLDLYRRDLAPAIGNAEIGNLYQEFARGHVASYLTGPWNLGEFARRLPDSLAGAWATAPMPGPEGGTSGISLAGGASLVVFRGTRHAEAAWRLVEYLVRPDVQSRFYRLTGDLPARLEPWEDPELASDPRLAAFREQLGRVVSTPKIPEWEQIAFRVQARAEEAIRGEATADEALARLDADVDRLLAKRRWLLDREAVSASGRSGS